MAATATRLAMMASGVLLLAACSANAHKPKAKPGEPATAAAKDSSFGERVAAAVEQSQAAATPADGAAVDEPGAEELQPGEDDSGDDESATVAAEPETLLHESMEAYQSAETFWQQGAFDDAFAALDHAYERMSEVPANGDAVTEQEKENLRNLISRRIVEIYASRQTAVGDPSKGIPLTMNDDVEREIASFQGPEREFFTGAYQRSGEYRPMILAQLHEAGLPDQLSWLPLVESGFKDRALSRARALGLWQFIASTGYRYGLDRDGWIDERMDPEKSTKAALAYLTALHDLFGDWMTALAAYNCGEQNVLRQINDQKLSYFDQFWDLYQRLPRETRRYVPRFLATLAIVQDPKKYGFDFPDPMPPVTYETVQIAHATKLAALDQALSLPSGTLAALNPELRRGASPNEAYTLKVPSGSGPTVTASIDSLPAWDPPVLTSGSYRVRRGETLSQIADRYRTSVRELMSLNHLRSANRIWPGQLLTVPGQVSVRRSTVRTGETLEHRVRTGDSLWSLASRYGTTVDRIRSDNGLSGNELRVGQVLMVRGGRGGGDAEGTYVVQSGDTLGSIAADKGVPLSRVLDANDLGTGATIYPGQQITIPD
jgi:membrane-bound lytic murein transglycosylase D